MLALQLKVEYCNGCDHNQKWRIILPLFKFILHFFTWLINIVHLLMLLANGSFHLGYLNNKSMLIGYEIINFKHYL